jgi:hypothetical protein
MSKFFIVTIQNGSLDIEYHDMQEGIQTSATECYVKLRDQAEPRETWIAITEAEFEAVKESLEPPA